MAAAFGEGAPWPGAVAVSGGGDSLALMILLTDWARATQRGKPVVLTVDHGLLPGSDCVAVEVVAKAQDAGLDAHILTWRGRKPSADIEGAARAARYRLMGNWCRAHGVAALYVAHTLEDQAETFLLRLARGSGVDGLSAMSDVAEIPQPAFGGLSLVRPLLAVPRARLRALLKARRIDWHDDAMNTDPRFVRSRMRALLPQLAEVGLSPKRMADAAKHLARARAALDDAASALLARASRAGGAFVLLDGAVLSAVPREIGLRAMACVLMQVSLREYRPRFERLETLFDAICNNSLAGGRTLHGCAVKSAPKRLQCFGPRTLLIGLEPDNRGGY